MRIITFGKYKGELDEKDIEKYFLKNQLDFEKDFYHHFYLKKFDF